MAIYAGNWNLHHANWSLDGTTRGQAAQHKNWLDNNNLTLINTPGVPTWQSRSGQQSIIDLTFANAPTSMTFKQEHEREMKMRVNRGMKA
jgi:hypothetical protein